MAEPADLKDEIKIPLSGEIKKYITWYNVNYNKTMASKGLEDIFKNSSIGKHIITTTRGKFLRGYRFLEVGETIGEGETYHMEQLNGDGIKNNFNIKSETPEQYHERLCVEFDKYSHLFQDDAKFNYDQDLCEVQTADTVNAINKAYLIKKSNKYQENINKAHSMDNLDTGDVDNIDTDDADADGVDADGVDADGVDADGVDVDNTDVDNVDDVGVYNNYVNTSIHNMHPNNRNKNEIIYEEVKPYQAKINKLKFADNVKKLNERTDNFIAYNKNMDYTMDKYMINTDEIITTN